MARERFRRARSSELQYASSLRQVSRQVEAIIRGLTRNGVVDEKQLREALLSYSDIIGPWARSVAEYMWRDVARRDAKAWKQHSREMGGDPTREAPFFFSKPSDAIRESGGTVNYPPRTANLHHEIELVVAIGTAAQATTCQVSAACTSRST